MIETASAHSGNTGFSPAHFGTDVGTGDICYAPRDREQYVQYLAKRLVLLLVEIVTARFRRAGEIAVSTLAGVDDGAKFNFPADAQ